VWDCICELFGLKPQTKNEKSRVGKIVTDVVIKWSPGVDIKSTMQKSMAISIFVRIVKSNIFRKNCIEFFD